MFSGLAYPVRTESPSISSVRSPPSQDGWRAGYTFIHAHDVQAYTHKARTDRQTDGCASIHTSGVHPTSRPQVSGGVGCGAAAARDT